MSNYKINNLQKYNDVYKSSVNDPEKFWEDIAFKNFIWKKKWDSVLEWDFSKPEIKWFKGAKLNITENCIDRHLKIRGDKTAIFSNQIILTKKLNILLTINFIKK